MNRPLTGLLLLKKTLHCSGANVGYEPKNGPVILGVAMARKSSSVPPTGNPFWSSVVQAEWELGQKRPKDLPPVPGDDEEVSRELDGPPLADQPSSRSTTRGRNLVTGEVPFRTPESWGDQLWADPTARGRWSRQEGKKTAGLLPEESPEVKPETGSQGPQPSLREEGEGSGLQRAIEKELLGQLQDENAQLLEEIRRLKNQKRSEEASVSQWSEVSGSQPQPPPPETPMKYGKGDVNGDLERFTPNGTKVPSGPPPRSPEKEVPVWPLEGYERVDVERVWKDFGSHQGMAGVDLRDRSPRRGAGRSRHGVCEGGDRRSRYGVCEGGASRPRHELYGGETNETMTEVLTSVQARAVWLERELESMKATLKNQEVAGLKSDYWKKPILHQARDEGPLSRADLGGLCGQGRALHSSGIGHGGVSEQARAGNFNHGLSGGDRALQGTVLGVQCPRCQECGDGPERKGEGDSLFGESHHEVCQRHQQLDGRDLCDPMGLGVGGGKGRKDQDLSGSQVREKSPQDALRSTNPTIPMLPPVGQKHSAIQAADWLVEIKPLISDISNRAHRWWEMTMEVTTTTYQRWLQASPLQRLRLAPPDPVDWHGLGSEQVIQRLEQMVTSILLPSVPPEIRNDLITNRHLWPGAIIYKILQSYQPGGWAERSTLLTDLTSTSPAKTPAGAATALRLWHRQKKRARELGASVPDALIQVRALEVIVSQAVLKFPQTMFRISTFRMEVGLDEHPREETIAQFAELLTAEMDAAALGTTAAGEQNNTPSTKALQAGEERSSSTADGGGRTCRFWGSENGCRHGRNCKFPHVDLKDASKRCFYCSALDHRKSNCPHRENQQSTSSSSTGGSGNGVGKNGGKDKGKGGKDSQKTSNSNKSSKPSNENGNGKGSGTSGEQDPKSTGAGATMSNAEDNSGKAPKDDGSQQEPTKPTTGETALVEEVTSLLRSLRAEAAVKVCGVKKIHPQDQLSVLLDGGATHCLRTCGDDREWQKARNIEVSLAEGSKVMKQCPLTRTLLTRERVQPIIPVSMVTSLGYQLHWEENSCQISHPSRPDLPVQLTQGCPTLEFDQGMRLFREVERSQQEQCHIRAILAGEEEGGKGSKYQQLRELFPEAPLRLLSRVPGKEKWDSAALPFNRKRRRQIQQAKFLVFNVFSGPDENYWKRMEKNGTVIVCLDLLLKCNLHDNNLTGWIEEVIQTRGVDLWLSGPPCRTTSVLRHRDDSGPKPLRGGNPQDRFGLQGLSDHQQQQVDGDSTLWLKNLWWMWLNKTHHPTSRNFIEQPRDPNEWCLELGEEEGLYPSFLRWEETSKVSLALGLKESRIEQGGLGHQTTKPSTLLSDLEEIQDIDGLKAKNQSQVKTKWPTDLEERLQFSRSLAAWAPGLKKLLSEVICRLASHLEPSVSQEVITGGAGGSQKVGSSRKTRTYTLSEGLRCLCGGLWT